MTLARSKLTAQGRTSIPAAVRKKLGIGPEATLEWAEKNGEVRVRRAGRQDWNDVRVILFSDGPPDPYTLQELKEGMRSYVQRKHARR